jgi:hypothetical protein
MQSCVLMQRSLLLPPGVLSNIAVVDLPNAIPLSSLKQVLQVRVNTDGRRVTVGVLIVVIVQINQAEISFFMSLLPLST